MYKVVEFEVDKGIQVVPTSWVSRNEKLCKWPKRTPVGFSN